MTLMVVFVGFQLGLLKHMVKCDVTVVHVAAFILHLQSPLPHVAPPRELIVTLLRCPSNPGQFIARIVHP